MGYSLEPDKSGNYRVMDTDFKSENLSRDYYGLEIVLWKRLFEEFNGRNAKKAENQG